jgi:hypothetical protein
MEERRISYRYKVALQGSFTVTGVEQQPIVVKNISARGLLARLGAPLPAPKRVVIKLELPDGQFAAEAICLRSSYEPPYDAAFLFIGAQFEAVDALRSFLVQQAREDAN